MFRIVRPAAYDFVDLTAAHLRRIAELLPQWIYFGTLYHMSGQAMASTLKLLDAAPRARRFYDVNLRDGNWSLAVVEQLSALANVVKLSDSEAEFLDASVNTGGQGSSVEDFCRRWSEQYHCQTMCVTFGERGSRGLSTRQVLRDSRLQGAGRRHGRRWRRLLRRLSSRHRARLGCRFHRQVRERCRRVSGQPGRGDPGMAHGGMPAYAGTACRLRSAELFQRCSECIECHLCGVS